MLLNKVTFGLVFSAVALLIAQSGRFAVSEWQALMFLRQSEESRVLALVRDRPTWPPSIRTGRAILLECERALLGDVGSFQPIANRTAIAANCDAVADTALKQNAAWSVANYIKALAGEHLQRPDISEAYLRISQESAPFEGWLAERRFLMIVRLGLPDNLGAVLDADISTMLDSASGRERLVTTYARRPELRDRVLASEALR